LTLHILAYTTISQEIDVAEETKTRAEDVIARECLVQRLRSLNLGADATASINAVAQPIRADQPAGSFFPGLLLAYTNTVAVSELAAGRVVRCPFRRRHMNQCRRPSRIGES
jgi:hypothetical protein